MKIKLLSFGVLLVFVLSADAQSYTLWATNVTDDVPTFTTADTLLTLSSTNGNLGRGIDAVGGYLGIRGGINANAVDSGAVGTVDEYMLLSLSPVTQLIGFASRYTRADIFISGFLSDPLITGTRGTISYNAGLVTIADYAWNGGNIDTFTLGNPAATLGQTLTVWVSDDVQAGPQFTFNQINYAVVPEPASWVVGLLGFVGLAIRRRDPH